MFLKECMKWGLNNLEIVIDFFPLYNMHVTEEKQGN